VQILSGLEAGERIVSSAAFLVDAESNLGTMTGEMDMTDDSDGMDGMDGMEGMEGMEGMDHSGSEMEPMEPDTTTMVMPDTTGGRGTMSHEGHEG
jgi:hypothetical protein